MSIPELQWAQVADKAGGPLALRQIPVPKPGPDEILVKIRYSGVCHTDLHAMKGDWPLPVKFPLVGGHEGAGHVVSKGELVKDFDIGDAAGIKWLNSSCLACEFCRQTDESQCGGAQLSGYTVDGTFQQYAVGKAANASKLPPNTPLDAVAPVLCAGITVYKGLKDSGVRPGQTVAIVGAGGGLGSLAVQYGRAMGLRVVAIDGGDEKRAMCSQLGAEVVSRIPENVVVLLTVGNIPGICGLYQVKGPRCGCSGSDSGWSWSPWCHCSGSHGKAFPTSRGVCPVVWNSCGYWASLWSLPEGTSSGHGDSQDHNQGKLCRQSPGWCGSSRVLQPRPDQCPIQEGSVEGSPPYLRPYG